MHPIKRELKKVELLHLLFKDLNQTILNPKAMKNKMKYDKDKVKAQNGKIAPPSVFRPADTNANPQKSNTKSK